MNGPEAGTLIIRLSLIAVSATLLATAAQAPARWLGAGLAVIVAASVAAPLARRAHAHAAAARAAREGEAWLALAARATSDGERHYCQRMARAAFDRHRAHAAGEHAQ